MDLLAVVLHEDQALIEVVVQDEQGIRRRVNVRWYAKDPQQGPPPDWLDLVVKEVRYQQGVGGHPLQMLRRRR